MPDYKRSVTFSLSDRQLAMIDEMVAKEKTKRSKWMQELILKEYIASGTISAINVHTAPYQGRIWGLNAFSEPAKLVPEGGGFCNPNIMPPCKTCKPIWDKAREARRRMEGQI